MKKTPFLKAVLENIADGVIVTDRAAVISYVNPSATKLFGYSQQELLGMNINLLLHKERDISYKAEIHQHNLMDRDIPVGKKLKIQAIKRDGTALPVSMVVNAVRYSKQVIYVMIIHDLSFANEAKKNVPAHDRELKTLIAERTAFLENVVDTLKRSHDEVSLSLQREKEVNRLKTRFVSLASHEFRTPLSGIQLSASLIEHYYDRLDKEKILDHLRKIKAAVNDLTGLLNDFLSVERIERGKVTSAFRSFDLRKLCLGVIDEMRIHAKKGQRLQYEHLRGNTQISLDYGLLHHCLTNLLSNAIKYSPENKLIKVVTDIDQDNYYIRVEDEGIGIPEGDLPSLFEAFFRAQNTREVQGTGLGLNIVKSYTELMNGKVICSSKQGVGTVFSLVFPTNVISQLEVTQDEFESVSQENA